ncbi:hypothetical protein C8J57DRAFT_1319969 [Mycena rebaudengoi]|nr:hypothetical protein C8J57DRAFT_1319969 [Mycena rebaudengoi]
MAVGVNTTGDNFYNCLRDQQLGSVLASATLQLFEYSLTFSDEVRLIWCLRLSASSILFLVARYAGLLSSLVTLAQTPASTVLVANLGTVLQYIVIIASEGLVRTWAIWEKKKSILVLLCVVSAAGITGAIVFLVRGAGTTTGMRFEPPLFLLLLFL